MPVFGGIKRYQAVSTEMRCTPTAPGPVHSRTSGFIRHSAFGIRILGLLALGTGEED